MEDNAADVCTEANMAGTCNDDGMCDCNEGFIGEDCSGMHCWIQKHYSYHHFLEKSLKVTLKNFRTF